MNSLEKALTESLKKGSQKSFEIVFKTYYARLCVYAQGYTKQTEIAEDIVKDFFVYLWDNREKISVNTSLSGYLFRSVHNLCINFLEREKRKNKTILIEDLAVLELTIKQPLSGDYPLGNLLARELENEINAQISKLPGQCREIFQLSRFDGFSHKEIAEKLKISENTVKVQVFRALCKIRNALFTFLWLIYSAF